MACIPLRRVIAVSGFPDFTYSGAYNVVDMGTESGIWKIALTGTGVLTINKKIKNATIQAQAGGGGGGASDGTTVGSDGTDGEIASLIQELPVGEYNVNIGAGGARGYSSAGYAGGNTEFDELLTVLGGSGGELAGGNSLEHASIYSNYGEGGLGGAIDQHDGALITRYYTKINTAGYAYIRYGPNKNSGSPGVVYNGEVFYLEDNTKYPDTDTSESTTWYKLADGRGYIDTSRCMALSTETQDTRAWYGTAGNPGVVLLSGKA